MSDEKETKWLTPMTDEELRRFVDDFVSGRIYTAQHVTNRCADDPAEAANMLGLVFMPLKFGALGDMTEEEVASIGTFWEYLDKASQRSINGFPMFFSCRCMLMDDWKRAAAAIDKERERREEIEV